MNLQTIQKLVINMPHRQDRLKECELQLKKFGVSSLTVIPGVFNTLSNVGIAKAHQNCVNYAKSTGESAVLIMEDDIVFKSENARNYCDLALKNLPEDWDLLLGGVYWTSGMTKHNEYWSRINNEFCALHFYVVNSKAYDHILSFDAANGMHIDRWMALSGLNCYVTNEMFALQSNGFSDNMGTAVNYDHLLNKFKLLK